MFFCFYSTYKELKLEMATTEAYIAPGFYSTYKELKLTMDKKEAERQIQVFIVPIRN